MNSFNWQLTQSMDAILFDCDGTLSTIEGIDELAQDNETKQHIKKMTADAMSRTGLNVALYAERLNLIKPTQDHVIALGQHYFAHRTADIENVIQILQRLGKKIYIISAGLAPAVISFGKLLQIPEEQIFAVDIEFDSEGHYLDFDRTSPLVSEKGKRQIVSEIKQAHPNVAYVGDGLNDLEVYDLAKRFVGFGGAFYRAQIADQCQFYITEASMKTLLPIVLTQAEVAKLTPNEKIFYQQGLAALPS